MHGLRPEGLRPSTPHSTAWKWQEAMRGGTSSSTPPPCQRDGVGSERSWLETRFACDGANIPVSQKNKFSSRETSDRTFERCTRSLSFANDAPRFASVRTDTEEVWRNWFLRASPLATSKRSIAG